ncbi:SGNH hydrolase domain-containing protein, partial [Pseudoxanthomonas putridarboris]
GVVVVVVSILLAHVSKYVIEERFRHARKGESFRPYVIGAGLTATLALFATGLTFAGDQRIEADQQRIAVMEDYPGALAWKGHLVPADVAVIPTPDAARVDRPRLHGANERCIAPIEGSVIVRCVMGMETGRHTLVLIGDSHAEHWIPAFDAAASNMGWKLLVFTKMGCAFTDVQIQSGSPRTGLSAYPQCAEWSSKLVAELLKLNPDLVVISQSPNHRIEGQGSRGSQQKIAEGVLRRLKPLRRQGIQVALLRHTPWLPASGPDCVKMGSDCVFSASAVLPQAALNMAIQIDPDLQSLDMTSSLCREDRCPAVVGNILVYRDQHHLTATYARTMADDVQSAVIALLKKER